MINTNKKNASKRKIKLKNRLLSTKWPNMIEFGILNELLWKKSIEAPSSPLDQRPHMHAFETAPAPKYLLEPEFVTTDNG